MIKGLKKRAWIVAIIIMALLSCTLLVITGAKYYSRINGQFKGNTTKFVISATPGGDDKEMALMPTVEGNYVGYEFYVSNSDGKDVSGVDQLYCIGLAAPKAFFESAIASINGRVEFAPMLVRTTDLTMTVDQLLRYSADTLPSSVTVYDKGNVLNSGDVNISIPLDENMMAYTWFDENNNPISFEFSADTAAKHKHFIIFSAKYIDNNVLDAGETYDIKNIQIVAYSEQINPNN